MIFDKQAMFSDAQAITATAASTDSIDLGPLSTVYGDAAARTRDIGLGAQVPINVQVVEAFNNLTSLTVTVEVDDNSAFSSPKTVYTSTAILLAALTAGKVLNLTAILPGADERYIRLKYTVAGTAPTLGKVTAGIVGGVQTNGVSFMA